MAREKDNIALSDEHNSRGIELADRGWLDEAIKEFKKAIDLDPHSAHAHDNLATVYAEKKLFREALGEYLTAIKLEPDSSSPGRLRPSGVSRTRSSEGLVGTVARANQRL